MSVNVNKTKTENTKMYVRKDINNVSKRKPESML